MAEDGEDAGAPGAEGWDEIRTAYQVARLGTVSAAAEVLGVHHATVIRHVDALERRLGTRLFQRHSRGYTPTEAGADLLRVGRETDDRLAQLFARLRGGGDAMTGEIIVTSLASAAPLLMPVLAGFHEAHPRIALRYLTDERLFRMEYGEAHVAIRAGPPPAEPDNVVQPFTMQEIALYASAAYVARNGMPADEDALGAHDFVAMEGSAQRAPAERWLSENVASERMVFHASDQRIARDAIVSGIGLGFLPRLEARALPDLVEVLPPRPDWSAHLWLVTHVDLHRTPKVQTFLAFLKAAVGRGV